MKNKIRVIFRESQIPHSDYKDCIFIDCIFIDSMPENHPNQLTCYAHVGATFSMQHRMAL